MAAPFLPNSPIPHFTLQTDKEEFVVRAESPMMVFVEEVKSLPFERRNGVFVNQRIFDPDDAYTFDEERDKVSKNVEQFVAGKVYASETTVINTSLSTLDLQVLLAVPEGSVPLMVSQHTQIISQQVDSSESKSFQLKFYFPEAGIYQVYPSNVCKAGKIIAKADKIADFVVAKDKRPTDNFSNFKNVIKYGTEDDIIEFLRTGNIFDEQSFSCSSVYWMLKDKHRYEQVRDIFKKRRYHDYTVWLFSLIHQDISSAAAVKHFHPYATRIPFYEYSPLTSTRAHRFLDQTKSTILNIEFRETYRDFVLMLLLRPAEQKKDENKLTWVYYLLLQGRVAEARRLFDGIKVTTLLS